MGLVVSGRLSVIGNEKVNTVQYLALPVTDHQPLAGIQKLFRFLP
jgi:hypothetical protein